MTCPNLRIILSSFAMLGILMTNHVAGSCVYSVPSKQTKIPVRLSADQKAQIQISYIDGENDLGLEKSCSAWVEVPLSAFPSSWLASRPADFAPAIHETMKEWNVDECVISVWFNNDVGDEMTEDEACVVERFEFGKRRHWSTSSEESCFQESGG